VTKVAIFPAIVNLFMREQ